MSLMSQSTGTDQVDMCYCCGQTGHKAFECHLPQSGRKQRKFNGKCNTWGKIDHKAKNCSTDPRNASKVLAWYKKKKARVDDSKVDLTSQDYEVVLMSGDLGFVPLIHLLWDPNIWIAGTGASIDMTPFTWGCTNMVPLVGDDGITGHDGTRL